MCSHAEVPGMVAVADCWQSSGGLAGKGLGYQEIQVAVQIGD